MAKEAQRILPAREELRFTHTYKVDGRTFAVDEDLWSLPHASLLYIARLGIDKALQNSMAGKVDEPEGLTKITAKLAAIKAGNVPSEFGGRGGRLSKVERITREEIDAYIKRRAEVAKKDMPKGKALDDMRKMVGDLMNDGKLPALRATIDTRIELSNNLVTDNEPDLDFGA